MTTICIANCCEKLHSVRGLYDKKKRLIVLFTSDVMYKKYKKLVYTAPDLLNAKKFGLIFYFGLHFRQRCNLKITTSKLTETDYYPLL